MIGRLRFKRTMFEGALDGGDDTIFLGEEQFQGFMSEIQSLAANPSRRKAEEESRENEEPAPESAATSESDEVRQLLTSLRDILQSPEMTRKLADAITQILSVKSEE